MISSFQFFFHFPLVMANLFSNFKKKFSFQISKIKIFKLLISNFKNRIFSFQISKMKISNFFVSILKNEKFQTFSFQIFVAYFNFFHFPIVEWPMFSNFNSNFKTELFQFFPFPSLVVWPIFFQKSNKKIQFKFQKRFFSF
jgi:hypothetical protein